MTDHFFIVGSGRCGTKLLRRMLQCHASVEVCMETHFLPTLHDEFGTEPIEFPAYLDVIDAHYDSKGSKWVENLHEIQGKDYGAFETAFEAVCADLESATAAEFTERFHEYLFDGPVPVVGDKTPHYGTVMDLITEFWPEAKFVHLVRDGVYAADSMTRHRGFRKQIAAGTAPRELDRQSYRGEIAALPDEPITIDEAAQFWESVVTLTCEQGAALSEDRYVEVRYEDVLADPKRVLEDLSAFLDLPADGDWLGRAASLPFPFYLRRVDARVDDATYRRVYAHVEETMGRFGYPADDIGYDVGKELRRSARYYRRHLFSPDYWRTFVGRRLDR